VVSAPFRLLALLAVILYIALCGCGSGNGSGGSQTAQAVNLAGNWEASTISNLGYDTFLSGAINQTGTQLSGTMNISGSPCAVSGALSGSVNGLKVTMSLLEGTQSVSLAGTASADGNSITGTYQAPAGGCTNGDSGTFSAARTSGGSCTSAPSNPTGLSASSTTISGTTLSWTAVNAPANCSITSYTVSENGSSIGTTSSTSFAVTGLAASTTYSFTVEAGDSVGTSGQSAAVSVTTLSSTGGGGVANWANGPSPTIPITSQCFSGDFNGDGKADIACYLGNGASGPNAGVWSVALSTGSGWQLESWAGGEGPAVPVTGQCVTGDFNGDGKTDIACFTGFAGEIWAVSLSTGSGWETQSWSGGPLLATEWTVVPIPGQCFAADFNGDGKTDLACSDGVDSVWSVALSTGTGWNTQSWSGGPVVPLPITDQCLDGDLNGDGKADLFCWTGEGGGWGVALSTGSSWQGSTWSGGPAPVDEWNVVPVPEQCFAADFTGAGKTDVACSDGTNSTWSMGVSTGSGWNTQSWSGGPVVPLPMTQQCLSGDLTGGGKADLFCWTGEGGGWGVGISTGSGFQGSIWSGGPVPVDEWNVVPVPEQCFTGDFNGDGITDVACYSGAGGVWSVALSSGSGW